MALLAGLAGVAHAVDFDLNVKAPALKVGPALKKSAESYSTTFARLSKASPVEMVTNKALFLEHFEIAWQLQRALDDHLPMEDLSAIGLVKREDGAIEIDLKAFPQWDSFTDRLMAMMPAMNYDLAGPQLINRGFRDSDIAAIRNYLSTHDLRTAAAAKTLPIAIGFSRLVKKYDKLKLPVRNDLVYSFIYQRAKAEALARREWAESLLQVLDAQRIRVLHSYFDEMPGFSVWAPSDTVAGIGGVLTQMRLPDYEDRVTAEARGVTP
ncbi:MAG: hypothetical protein ABI769_14135 [Pseudomonadota bacterium]